MASTRSSVRTLTASAVLAATTTVLAGCGGGAGSIATGSAGSGGTAASTTADKAPKACSLFTKKLAQSELGKAVKLTINKYENPLLSQCEYTGPSGFVAVLSGPWYEVKAEASGGKPVSGLGDQAISSAAGLVIRKGTLAISVESAITGTFSGAAANKVQKRQLASEKRLGATLVKSL